MLVRDPRAVMLSRKNKLNTWCRKETDCAKVEKLCSGMVEDYKAAARLQKLYSDRFM